MKHRRQPNGNSFIPLRDLAAEKEIAYNCMLGTYGMLIHGLRPQFMVWDNSSGQNIMIRLVAVFQLVREGRIVAVGGNRHYRHYLAVKETVGPLQDIPLVATPPATLDEALERAE